jgi:hypothetical protein
METNSTINNIKSLFINANCGCFKFEVNGKGVVLDSVFGDKNIEVYELYYNNAGMSAKTNVGILHNFDKIIKDKDDWYTLEDVITDMINKCDVDED